MKKKILFIVLLCWLFPPLGQGQKIDSLEKVLLTAKEDTNKFNALLQLGNIFTNSNPDTAIYFHTQATLLAGKLKEELKKAEAIRATGWDNFLKGDYQKALSLYNRHLS